MFILQIFNDKTYEWFEISETGEIILRRQLSDLSACPKINPHENLITLFPGEKITMRFVKLPKMRESEKAQAIPYLLEEHLASDPENIAVALGNTRSDGMTAVAVFDKNNFDAQLQILQAENLFPRVMLPDFLSLLLESATWTIVLQSQMALVRIDAQNGFSVDIDNLFLLLKLNLEKNKERKPKKIICWQQDTMLDVMQLETLGVPIEMRGESKYSYFDAKNLLSKSTLNLLQGKYRPKIQSSKLRKNWFICGAVAVIFIAFLFLSNMVQWIYFRHQSIVLEQKVLVVYQALFPGSKEILEPRFRAKNLLKRFESASRGSEFFRLLGIAGKTVLQFQNMSVQTLQFNHHQLRLTVQTKNLQLLSEWSNTLRAQGLQVQQHVLNNDPNDVQAEITIKESA